MRRAELTAAGCGGARRLPAGLPAGAPWSGTRGSSASGTAAHPAAMAPPRWLVQAAAGGRRAPPGPLSRPPRKAAQLGHGPQPVHLEGANNIVPRPQHVPLLDDADAQPSSSSSDASGDSPAALAAVEQTDDQAAAAFPSSSSGFGASPSTPTNTRSSWAGGQTASQLAGLHRPAGLVVGSAWLLAVSVQLAGEAPQSAAGVVSEVALLPHVPAICRCLPACRHANDGQQRLPTPRANQAD